MIHRKEMLLRHCEERSNLNIAIRLDCFILAMTILTEQSNFKISFIKFLFPSIHTTGEVDEVGIIIFLLQPLNS